MSKAESIGTPEQLTSIINSGKPVLIDFWAPWCGPCKSMGPVFDEIAVECQDRIHVVKVNVDQFPDLAKQYGVRAIPTAVFQKGTQVIETIVGLNPKTTIVSKLNPHLS